MVNQIIRPVGKKELDILRDLSIETFRETFTQHNTQQNMDRYILENLSKEKIASEFSNPDSHFFFSVDGDKPSGYLKLNAGTAQTEFKHLSDIEIERIYVLKNYQGFGIGAQLLKHVVRVAQDGRFPNIWLGVWEQNVNAISFYRKYGFEPIGKHSFFVGADEQTDILMRIDVASLTNKLLSAAK
jgi:ribosomal protein S18 acetylase RimI-like enzyme